MKICITGSKNYDNKTLLKSAIHDLHKQDPELIIVGLGEELGADPLIRKYAIEFGVTFQEYNVFHTAITSYTYLPQRMYGKKYSPRNYYIRNLAVTNSCKACFIFMRNDTDYDQYLLHLMKQFKKVNKPAKIFTSL